MLLFAFSNIARKSKFAKLKELGNIIYALIKVSNSNQMSLSFDSLAGDDQNYKRANWT